MTVTVEDVHNAWAAWMSGKDPNHPSIQPLGALPQSVQREDAPFVGAIHAVAARLTHCGPHRLNE